MVLQSHVWDSSRDTFKIEGVGRSQGDKPCTTISITSCEKAVDEFQNLTLAKKELFVSLTALNFLSSLFGTFTLLLGVRYQPEQRFPDSWPSKSHGHGISYFTFLWPTNQLHQHLLQRLSVSVQEPLTTKSYWLKESLYKRYNYLLGDDLFMATVHFNKVESQTYKESSCYCKYIVLREIVNIH